MSNAFDTTDRFLRPIDVARIKRNQNRIHVQHVLRYIRNGVLFLIVTVVCLWAYRHTQSDARFAVRTIEVAGAIHTSRAELDAVTARYIGMNLFKIDIASVQHDLRALPWVNRVAIEKKLPATLRISLSEREPAALAPLGGELRYVDDHGIAFAPLTPAVGDPDLPLIVATSEGDLARVVVLLNELKQRDPAVYSRISQVRPVAPDGFAIFDRELGAVIYANRENISEKWRALYGIVQSENLSRGQVEYADLRFADRIVVRPVHQLTTAAAPVLRIDATQITN